MNVRNQSLGKILDLKLEYISAIKCMLHILRLPGSPWGIHLQHFTILFLQPSTNKKKVRLSNKEKEYTILKFKERSKIFK